MKRRNENTITNVSTLDTSDYVVNMCANFEVCIPIAYVSGNADKILDDCLYKYKELHPEVDIDLDVYHQFLLNYSVGYEQPEYTVAVYIWLKEKDGCGYPDDKFYEQPEYTVAVYIWLKEKDGCGYPDDKLEVFDEIPVNLTDEAKADLKKVIKDKLLTGEGIFE